jgi:hypothetical protein
MDPISFGVHGCVLDPPVIRKDNTRLLFAFTFTSSASLVCYSIPVILVRARPILESDSSVLVTTTRRRLTDTSNVILGGCFLI